MKISIDVAKNGYVMAVESIEQLGEGTPFREWEQFVFPTQPKLIKAIKAYLKALNEDETTNG